MRMKIAELREKMLRTFGNFTPEEANSMTDYLLWAEMAGVKTQGIVKMVGEAQIQNIKPKGQIKVEKDTKLSQLIDAKG